MVSKNFAWGNKRPNWNGKENYLSWMFVHLTANQQKKFDKNVGEKIVQRSINYFSNEFKKEKLFNIFSKLI